MYNSMNCFDKISFNKFDPIISLDIKFIYWTIVHPDAVKECLVGVIRTISGSFGLLLSCTFTEISALGAILYFRSLFPTF